MTAVKMLMFVNVGRQVSADVCKGDGLVRPSDANGEGGGGSKWFFLRTFFVDEPVSRNLSRNLSRKTLSRSRPHKLLLADS